MHMMSASIPLSNQSLILRERYVMLTEMILRELSFFLSLRPTLWFTSSYEVSGLGSPPFSSGAGSLEFLDMMLATLCLPLMRTLGIEA